MRHLRNSILYIVVIIFFLATSIWVGDSFDLLQSSFFDRVGINDHISSILVMIYVLANLPVIFIFGRKAISESILFDRGKAMKGSKEYIASEWKISNEYDIIFDCINKKLTEDHYTINENLTLHKTSGIVVAFHIDENRKLKGYITYLFFYESNVIDLEELEQVLLASFAYVEKAAKEFLTMLQPNLILCLFTENVSAEASHKIQEMFDTKGAFLIVVYELSTSQVYFMSGNGKGFKRLSNLQTLVRRYIIGASEN